MLIHLNISEDDTTLPTPRVDESDVEAMLGAICADTAWSKPTQPLGINPDWQPHLIAPGAACHIHTVRKLRPHIRRRIDAAQRAGHRVHVAGPLEYLFESDTLVALSDADVRPILVREEGGMWLAREYRTVAALVYLNGWMLEAAAFQHIASSLLERALIATTADGKGWRFEDFLAFFFNQSSYFNVHVVNFETATEEIDVVLTRQRHAERDERVDISPIVLVSGKNVTGTVGAPEMRSLENKMLNRTHACRLGFLCAARTFAGTIREHQLLMARDDRLIVTINGDTFRTLLADPEALDAALVRLIQNAALIGAPT